MKDKRQRILIIAAAVVVGLWLGDKVILSKLTEWWDARASEITKLQSNIADGKALIKQERVYRAKWDQMKTNALPDNQSVALEQISKSFHEWAEESGVTLDDVRPQWKIDADDHKTVSCRVGANGTLWMLAKFIYDIERDPVGLKIESLDFTAADNTGQKLSLGLQVSGLVLNSQ
jgi:Tfp pilus assembly protein PilO